MQCCARAQQFLVKSWRKIKCSFCLAALSAAAAAAAIACLPHETRKTFFCKRFSSWISYYKNWSVCSPSIRSRLECYATPSRLWRAAIYCGTLWLPLPLPPLQQCFSLSFSPNLVQQACLVGCLMARGAADCWQ